MNACTIAPKLNSNCSASASQSLKSLICLPLIDLKKADCNYFKLITLIAAINLCGCATQCLTHLSSRDNTNYPSDMSKTQDMLEYIYFFFSFRELDLKRPIYQKTACYGHFGREEFTWEIPKKLVY